MTSELLLGALFLLTVSVHVFAFPGEVLRLGKRNPSESFLFKVHLFSFLMYASWLFYAAWHQQIELILAQSVGMFYSGVFAGQTLWRYSRQKRRRRTRKDVTNKKLQFTY